MKPSSSSSPDLIPVEHTPPLQEIGAPAIPALFRGEHAGAFVPFPPLERELYDRAAQTPNLIAHIEDVFFGRVDDYFKRIISDGSNEIYLRDAGESILNEWEKFERYAQTRYAEEKNTKLILNDWFIDGTLEALKPLLASKYDAQLESAAKRTEVSEARITSGQPASALPEPAVHSLPTEHAEITPRDYAREAASESGSNEDRLPTHPDFSLTH